jgi:hypothetical protein
VGIVYQNDLKICPRDTQSIFRKINKGHLVGILDQNDQEKLPKHTSAQINCPRSLPDQLYAKKS